MCYVLHIPNYVHISADVDFSHQMKCIDSRFGNEILYLFHEKNTALKYRRLTIRLNDNTKKNFLNEQFFVNINIIIIN